MTTKNSAASVNTAVKESKEPAALPTFDTTVLKPFAIEEDTSTPPAADVKDVDKDNMQDFQDIVPGNPDVEEPHFYDDWADVASHPETGFVTLEWLYRRSQGKGIKNSLLQLIHPIPKEVRTNLLCAIAAHPCTMTDILNEIREDKTPEVQLALSNNPMLPTKVRTEILDTLMQTSRKSVWFQVLDREELSPELREKTFEMFMRGEHGIWLHEVAQLKTLDEKMVIFMLKDASKNVQKRLYANEHLSFESYEKMLDTKDIELRSILKTNKGLPDVFKERIG